MGNIFIKEKKYYETPEGSIEEYWHQYSYDTKYLFLKSFEKYVDRNIVYSLTKAYIYIPKKNIYGVFYFNIFKTIDIVLNEFNIFSSGSDEEFVSEIINIIKKKIDKPFVLSVVDLAKLTYMIQKKDYFALCINYVM